jgi:hypothetical protein
MKLPDLRSMLESAAEAVPESDRSYLPDVVEEGRKRRRVRRATLAALLVIATATGSMLAVADRDSDEGVAVVAPSTTPTAAPTSSTTPETSTSIGPTGSSGPSGNTCTEADASRPLGAMPVARGVSQRFFLDPNAAWLDPAGSAAPAVSADTAWPKLTAGLRGGGRPQLLLGYYSAFAPSKGGVPENIHVLAWAVYIDDIALVPMGGPSPAPGTTTPPQPLCGFGVWYSVLDATTGQQLVIASHG